jgi:hypothetical protein|nr:MAG TPA: 50S ribosomal protein L20 [Caudoviricetes sp.]
MAKVYAPNKDYNGVTASVPFTNGVGFSSNPYLLDWFKEHGYEVEEEDDIAEAKSEANTDISQLSYEELKSLAKDKGVDGYHKMKKEELLDALKDSE